MDEFGGCVGVVPVLNPAVRGLCCRPYPNHPHGCPNFSKKQGCPPKAPMIDKTLDLSKPVLAIYNRFNLGEHIERMRAKHPLWTDRQLRCCLYWQPGARKQLKKRIRNHLQIGMKVVGSPEAQGVDLTATMRSAGIELEWPPMKWAYQIVLAGVPK